ncbi:MAG: carboxypeptidase M32 [Williamsia sp.]|nr:carboxypeptidase M32 [Williamsia sp.]
MVNMASTRKLYSKYKEQMQQIADIRYAAAVLQWDQETYMPARSIGHRARQIATLSETAHKLFTAKKTGQLLETLAGSGDLSEEERKNIELSLYDYNKLKKLPATFVRAMSEAVSKSYQYWAHAKAANSFETFEDPLDKLIHLKRREASQLGWEGHPYNALLNDYERGCTVSFLDAAFSGLRPPLSALLSSIARQPQVDNAFLQKHYPRELQWQFGLEIIKKLGFDFEAGRQDISEHPFTTSFSSTDVRVTTRISENDFSNMCWSCIHETGHALYEQGLPAEEYGLPLGEYSSLSIHESQSRLWENNVGRSQGFWQHHFPLLLTYFPEQLGSTDPVHFYKAINRVQASLIRTEADELTYHFHVMIRYELEKGLIEGSVKTHDIPAFWNELYEKYLGIGVPDDRNGCLQDVHWSHGSFGYFPTYSLGSLYAAQFYDAALKQIPGLEQDLQNGNTTPLLAWLREQVHQHGRKWTSDELCKNITGESLNSVYFLEYAAKKYHNIYNFTD